MSQQEPTIYYLKNEDILNKDILFNYIYPNMKSNYYWSDDFSEEFYINAANAGFITVSNMFDGKLLLLPELQYEYAILDFKNLHISKKVQKLLNKRDFRLNINKNVKETLLQLSNYHEDCWLRGKYFDLIKRLNHFNHKTIDFKLVGIELKDLQNDKIVAGELGYIIGSTYTSLTGFCSKSKKYNNCGTLQLVLLAQYLQEKKFSFWNLGHANMDYKLKLGANTYSREDFLKRWIKQTKKRVL